MRGLAAVLALCALLAASSALAAPSPTDQARLDSTIRYLQDVQNADGGFGGDAGGKSGQGFSAWVALALAAAGVNPQCQAKPGGIDAYSFLVSHFEQGLKEEIPYPLIPTTAYERELMVVNAAGTDPRDFGAHDLIAEILERARPDGSFPYVEGGAGAINVTVFAILSLAPVNEPGAQAAIQRAADWIEGQQGDDGSWAWSDRDGRGEVDMTGAAIQALDAAGRPGSATEQRALEFLRDALNPDGGFPQFRGESESNVASTAWAVQGMWAAGIDPDVWVTGEGREPLSYMASLQQPDGHIRWKQSQDMNGVWMTAYVAPAFAGQAHPIPRTAPCSRQPVSANSDRGQGGLSSQQGSGVIAGGGGKGAPLFSRPKPQSKGRTPGGVRQIGPSPRARNQSESRRGENKKQATGTATSEPTGKTPSGAGGGREVTGTLISARPGAPGLHSAGAGTDEGRWLAVGIGAASLLLVLAGARLERRERGRS